MSDEDEEDRLISMLIREALGELLDRAKEINPRITRIRAEVVLVLDDEDDEEEDESAPDWPPGGGFPLLTVPDDDGTLN